MSTRAYTLPVEQTRWEIPGGNVTVFNWEYDEGRDKDQQVIFESTSTAPASLSRIPAAGADPQQLLGKTIYYWRKTNTFKVSGAVGASGSQ